MTVLWVSMGLHVGAFLFWVVTTVATQYTLNKQYREKGESLQQIYDEARIELEANIENVQKMAHTANEQYVRNLYGGNDER